MQTKTSNRNKKENGELFGKMTLHGVIVFKNIFLASELFFISSYLRSQLQQLPTELT